MHSTTTNGDAAVMTEFEVECLPVMLAPIFRPISFVLTHWEQSSCAVRCDSIEDSYAIRWLNVILCQNKVYT